MRVLGNAVLIFQIIVLALAIPVAIVVSGVPAVTAGWTAGVLIVLAIAAMGVITKPAGLVLGTAVQVGTLVAGLVVPTLLLLGIIFAVLWGFAVVLGRRVDRAKAAAADQSVSPHTDHPDADAAPAQ